MSYDCIRCLSATDNDDDICDDCKSETRDNEMIMTLRERVYLLRKGLERVHTALQDPTRPRQSIGEMVAALLNPKE